MAPKQGALIGFGAVAAGAHAPAFKYSKKLALVAAVDASADRRAEAKRLIGGLRTYATVDELFDAEPRLDFVDIATPPHLHSNQITDALKRGVHVLCEKPLTLTHKEFLLVERTAKNSRKAVFPVHNWKHAPLFSKLRELVRSEIIGPVRHVEWHVHRTQPSLTARNIKTAPNNWRTDDKLSGGGILMDHGWHAVYLVSSLTGASPKTAHGALKRSEDISAEDEATCLLYYPAATAVIHLTWRAPARGHRGFVLGTKGTIEIGDDRLSVVKGCGRTQTYVFPEPLSRSSAHPEWFANMLPEFEQAMAVPARRARTLAEAGDCIRIIEGIYRAETR